jgi:hypothetical protein
MVTGNTNAGYYIAPKAPAPPSARKTCCQRRQECRAQRKMRRAERKPCRAQWKACCVKKEGCGIKKWVSGISSSDLRTKERLSDVERLTRNSMQSSDSEVVSGIIEKRESLDEPPTYEQVEKQS